MKVVTPPLVGGIGPTTSTRRRGAKAAYSFARATTNSMLVEAACGRNTEKTLFNRSCPPK
jgi:hypothetical protein